VSLSATILLRVADVSSAQLWRNYLIGKSIAEEHSSVPSSPQENFDASIWCAVNLPLFG